MKELRLAGFILFFVISLFLIALLISVLIHHFRRYILRLKECIIVYRRKKQNLKKEKLKAKLDKLNQENE